MRNTSGSPVPYYAGEDLSTAAKGTLLARGATVREVVKAGGTDTVIGFLVTPPSSSEVGAVVQVDRAPGIYEVPVGAAAITRGHWIISGGDGEAAGVATPNTAQLRQGVGEAWEAGAANGTVHVEKL